MLHSQHVTAKQSTCSKKGRTAKTQKFSMKLLLHPSLQHDTGISKGVTCWAAAYLGGKAWHVLNVKQAQSQKGKQVLCRERPGVRVPPLKRGTTDRKADRCCAE